MEGSGECCDLRYAGGVAKVDSIMLKFRPIAPKPASNGSLSGGVATPENNEPSLKATGRKKRRQTRDVSNDVNNSGRSKRCFIRKRKTSPEETTSGVKTLSFLPEAPDDVKEFPKKGSDRYPLWVSFDGGRVTPGVSHLPEDPTAAVRRRRVVVVVESVTGAWAADLNALGRTDEEKLLNLDHDTCPGFVTDSLNFVRWINGAYRRMVAGDVREVVVTEGVVVPVGAAAFTCLVRVITCGKENTNCATLFCDVWRLECGGFAWRMDTKVALSLGRELNGGIYN